MQNLDTLYTDATCYERDEVSDGPEAVVGRYREELRDDVRVEQEVENHRPRTKFIDV